VLATGSEEGPVDAWCSTRPEGETARADLPAVPEDATWAAEAGRRMAAEPGFFDLDPSDGRFERLVARAAEAGQPDDVVIDVDPAGANGRWVELTRPASGSACVRFLPEDDVYEVTAGPCQLDLPARRYEIDR